jgi:predicted dehydrogenase
MSDHVTRRNFLKAAGVTAGVTIASGFSPFSYAQNEKVRVAAIGTGGQGSLHLRYGFTGASKEIELVAVCDIYKPHLEGGWKQAVGEDAEKQKNVKQYMNYKEMLEKEQLDAVVIATPLFTHHPIAMDALSAGKYVFCEKTLAYTIDECRDIVKKCHETGLFCQVGHQRRYNPGYNRAMARMVGENAIGRLNHITAQWHRNDSWRRPVDMTYQISEEEKALGITDLEKHINWRLYHERSAGGLMTELASHQLDVCNWFLNTPPARVSGYGGVDYWKDGRDVDDNVVLIYEYELLPSNPVFGNITKRIPAQNFGQINRPYRVRVTYSSICSNAQRGAGELLQGDRGAFELTEAECFMYKEPTALKPWDSGGTITAKEAAANITAGKSREVDTSKIDMKENIKYPAMYGPDGKEVDQKDRLSVLAAVDVLQFKSFANDIKTKGTPKANQVVGLMAAVAALSGEQSMREGKTIDIDKALYTFDFETPDPYRYDNPDDSKA